MLLTASDERSSNNPCMRVWMHAWEWVPLQMGATQCCTDSDSQTRLGASHLLADEAEMMLHQLSWGPEGSLLFVRLCPGIQATEQGVASALCRPRRDTQSRLGDAAAGAEK